MARAAARTSLAFGSRRAPGRSGGRGVPQRRAALIQEATVDPLSLLWLYLILASLQPLLVRQLLLVRRRQALRTISRERGATVITLIHRQESMSFLGIPIVRYIDIDDAQDVLRAIHETAAGRAIEIILHTPGGLVIAAQQIAAALADHDGHVTAVVPHYAMSGGTLVALAADDIRIESHASLGPVDPQLGQYAAASLVTVARLPGDHDDETLLKADVGLMAIAQVQAFTERLLLRRLPPERARDVAHLLASGVWTHDHPLMAPDLEILGLPVREGLTEAERDFIALYPQPTGRTPAVEYVPGPPRRSLPRRSGRPYGSS
jgi:ClpP class serine protease